MASYNLLVFSWNDIFPSRSQTGTSADLLGQSFTFNGGGDIVEYIDNDSFNGSFGDHGFVTNTIRGTIDGQSVNNGMVNPEYSYFIQDSQGNVVGEMYAITLNNDNLSDIEAFTFDFQPKAGETYTISGRDTTPATPYSNLYVCLVAGTSVDTPHGPRLIEDIRPGDLVTTHDSGAQKVLWTGQRALVGNRLVLHPATRPIRIEAGALGHGLPANPLVVSRQHRVHLSSPVAERMFGSEDMLIPAKDLLMLDGVSQIAPQQGITYHHLLCEGHEMIRSSGCWTETLYLGNMAQSMLSPEQIAEIRQTFPDLTTRMALHPFAAVAEANRGRLERFVAREAARGTRLTDHGSKAA